MDKAREALAAAEKLWAEENTARLRAESRLAALEVVIARQRRRIEVLNIRLRLQRELARVYRRKWESVVQPPQKAPTEAQAKEQKLRSLIDAAIAQRTPPGDTVVAATLRAYADHQLALRGIDEAENIADEILEGEEE